MSLPALAQAPWAVPSSWQCGTALHPWLVHALHTVPSSPPNGRLFLLGESRAFGSTSGPSWTWIGRLMIRHVDDSLSLSTSVAAAQQPEGETQPPWRDRL